MPAHLFTILDSVLFPVCWGVVRPGGAMVDVLVRLCADTHTYARSLVRLLLVSRVCAVVLLPNHHPLFLSPCIDARRCATSTFVDTLISVPSASCHAVDLRHSLYTPVFFLTPCFYHQTPRGRSSIALSD